MAKFIIHILGNLITLYFVANQFKHDGIVFVLSGREMVSIMPEQGRARKVRLLASGNNQFQNGCKSPHNCISDVETRLSTQFRIKFGHGVWQDAA